MILDVNGVRQSYGGLNVLTDINFKLEKGEKAAVIGPNGAGKTTLFNVLSGLVPLSAGSIRLMNHDVTQMTADARTAMGLARSFQLSSLFPALDVLTNVLLAIQGVKPTRYRMFRSIRSYKADMARAQELLELVNLWEKRDTPITDLGHGEQRQMDIILSLASNPKMLLLDEPNAGLTRGDAEKLIDMVNDLVADTTLLVTDHNTDLIFNLAEKVLVLYYGKIIAQGTPDQIQSDPKVREIYLGSEKAGDNARVD